jgi:hypothetical protein
VSGVELKPIEQSPLPHDLRRGQSCGNRVVPTEERFGFAHRTAIEQPIRLLAESSTKLIEQMK